MAQEFSKWINFCCNDLAKYGDDRIIVVGIIGNETAENRKFDLLNDFFRDSIFFDSFSTKPNNEDESFSISVQAYYEPESSTVYFLLNGLHDLDAQRYLFGSNIPTNKNFFEKIATLEMEYVHFLHFFFVSCHLIVVVKQGSRFNGSFMRTLKAVKMLRLKTKNIIRNALEENGEIPHSWSIEGRLASPKMIFAFNSSSMRNDLTTMLKRKIFLDKAEKSLENQIVSVLKFHRIVDNYCPESALASLPSISIPFVHIIQRNLEEESVERRFSKYIFDFFTDKSIVDLPEQFEKLQSVKNQTKNHEFCEFLRESITSAKSDNSKSKPVYKFPKLSQFLIGAKIVYRQLIIERNFDESEVNEKVNVELTAIEILANKALNKAIQNYEIEMQMQNAGTSFTVLSKQQHEQLIIKVTENLSKLIKTELLKDVTESLHERCTKIWKNGHERCEALSLFGHMCSLPIHIKFKTEEMIDLKLSTQRKNHLSGVEFLSTCNCGNSQLIRVDPYNLKEANFDFYEQYEYFECCKNLDKFQFELFDPNDEAQKIRRASRLSLNQTLTKEVCRTNETDSQDEDNKKENDSQKKRHNKTISNATACKAATNEHTTTASYSTTSSSSEDSENEEEEDDGSTSNRQDDDESEREYALPNPLEYNIRFFDNNDGDEGAIDVPKDSNVLLEEVESDELEGEEDEEEEADFDKLSKILKIKISDTLEDPGHYLDNYDSHLTRHSPTSTVSAPKLFNAFCLNEHKSQPVNSRQLEELKRKFKGEYLEHVPFCSRTQNMDEPRLLPLYPSWSVVCVGSSRIYNHSAGLRNQPNFKPGYLPFLLPWDVYLTVKTEQWQNDVNLIRSATSGTLNGEIVDSGCSLGTGGTDYGASRRRQRRYLEQASDDGTNREKVKLFVGFDFDCPRGHRFFIQSPTRALKFRRSDGELLALDAGELIATDLPIWMPCTCQRKPRQIAQLMRIHIVTPKAPVTVRLNPKVQLIGEDGYFHLGNGPVNLNWGKYYVIRFPFVYVGPTQTPILPPEWPNSAGKLLANCMDVVHTPIVDLSSI